MISVFLKIDLPCGVLDIFLGSGNSQIAAERVGRHFRGVDVDPAYGDVAITRLDQLSGQVWPLIFTWYGGYMKGVTLDFSRPGKPTDNAFIESFNGKLRAEYLNQH